MDLPLDYRPFGYIDLMSNDGSRVDSTYEIGKTWITIGYDPRNEIRIRDLRQVDTIHCGIKIVLSPNSPEPQVFLRLLTKKKSCSVSGLEFEPGQTQVQLDPSYATFSIGTRQLKWRIFSDNDNNYVPVLKKSNGITQIVPGLLKPFLKQTYFTKNSETSLRVDVLRKGYENSMISQKKARKFTSEKKPDLGTLLFSAEFEKKPQTRVRNSVKKSKAPFVDSTNNRIKRTKYSNKEILVDNTDSNCSSGSRENALSRNSNDFFSFSLKSSSASPVENNMKEIDATLIDQIKESPSEISSFSSDDLSKSMQDAPSCQQNAYESIESTKITKAPDNVQAYFESIGLVPSMLSKHIGFEETFELRKPNEISNSPYLLDVSCESKKTGEAFPTILTNTKEIGFEEIHRKRANLVLSETNDASESPDLLKVNCESKQLGETFPISALLPKESGPEETLELSEHNEMSESPDLIDVTCESTKPDELAPTIPPNVINFDETILLDEDEPTEISKTLEPHEVAFEANEPDGMDHSKQEINLEKAYKVTVMQTEDEDHSLIKIKKAKTNGEYNLGLSSPAIETDHGPADGYFSGASVINQISLANSPSKPELQNKPTPYADYCSWISRFGNDYSRTTSQIYPKFEKRATDINFNYKNFLVNVVSENRALSSKIPGKRKGENNSTNNINLVQVTDTQAHDVSLVRETLSEIGEKDSRLNNNKIRKIDLTLNV